MHIFEVKFDLFRYWDDTFNFRVRTPKT